MFEFHISRQARDRYRFSETLFSLSGNVVFADLAATREFAHRMNLERDVERSPERAIHPGALNAMGLIDEALHLVMAQYRRERDPQALADALSWFASRLGDAGLNQTLMVFVENFPPVDVYRGKKSAEEWLAGSSENVSHRAVALEELILLWLANANRAFQPFRELFDDEPLAGATSYSALTAALRDYFETRPRFGHEQQNLIDMLRAPALASPDSLEGQLAFIREKWAYLIGDLVRRLLIALDVLKEEQVAIWMRFHPRSQRFHGGAQQPGDSGAGAIPRFSGAEQEYEHFTADQEWMPRAVVMAKSVYVWLDQLSKTYGRSVRRLDEIPDEELDLLARRGFNGLWLIGLWERSSASQRIKQMCGNPEAAASAYSLHDYTVAGNLGGEAACANLRDRARARGIRLASDMVPNHTGVDSRWMIEHSDWFISLPHSPFPSYSFNGPDVGGDGRVEIKIEDHYYDRSDAAVVFRRLDRWTGDTRYVYHGNDGTSFPWNDTAQLNYLKPEVREAVIQTILHVARMFPIIRFDAAMTLAKRHYQRLWFPEPGTGGSIPSRAEHGLSKAAFDVAMPKEFWREVVDRIAAEAPNTLLIAEAFWLMEGYFVRTLGMHRVYNSAFMNMLRDEENANYRSVIKNTLTFDPDVLKRYVNFMNNPDERTAVDQFGKGDKYFGVCTLMATLPGLPMFGHGQIEGFTERYGMEYVRAYRDEQPDPWLVARHEREISPLLHRRYLFADVKDFLLYDFFTDHGHVNEDVFAFSNRSGDERALVVFNNRYATASGWIRASCAYAEKSAGGKHLRQRTLGESFALSADASSYVACRDVLSGLEHLHCARDLAERGMKVDLHAYQTHVFLDWEDLHADATHPWGELCDALAGRGVSSLDDALRDLQLKPVHQALLALVDPATAEALATCSASQDGPAARARVDTILNTVRHRAGVLLAQVEHYGACRPGNAAGASKQPAKVSPSQAQELMVKRLRAVLNFESLCRRAKLDWPAEAHAVLPLSDSPKAQRTAVWGTVLVWCAVEAIGRLQDAKDPKAASGCFDALRLRGALADAFAALGFEGEERWRAAARVRASFEHAVHANAPYTWTHDPDVAWVIGAHQHEGVSYLAAEDFERLLWWMALRGLLDLASEPKPDLKRFSSIVDDIKGLLRVVEHEDYRIEALEDTALHGSDTETEKDEEQKEEKVEPRS
ncbi:MAG TPA: alpha-amylase family glycosyl hydrolase [Candidatus Angelobacter sp.]|nr:alpha-amylase family glycosyl hydrolase [Candidatus Angelobacter sp.]